MVKGRALARPSERSERFEPLVRFHILMNNVGAYADQYKAIVPSTLIEIANNDIDFDERLIANIPSAKHVTGSTAHHWMVSKTNFE